MNGFLRQSTASQARLIGPFIDDTDFKTASTGLTVANTDVKLRANGTTLSNKNSGGGTHEVNGMYSVSWDATDTANVGELFYSVKVAGALQVFGSYVVLEEAVYDALFAASAPGYVSGATVDVTKWNGTAVASPHTAGYPVVTVKDGTGTGEIDTASGLVQITAAQVASIVDAVWDEVITTEQHNVGLSAGVFLRNTASNAFLIRASTLQAATATTAQLDLSASSVDDIYNSTTLVISAGTGVGQTRRIVDYNGTTKTATLDSPWIVTPAGGSTFGIYATTSRSVISDEGLAQAGGASTITLASTASTSDDIYNNSFVTIQAGTGSGQTRVITDYVGSTRVATVDSAWAVQPDISSVYAVIPNAAQASDSGSGNGPTVAEIVTGVHTTQMIEAYAADGVAPTLAQIQFMVWSRLAEFVLSGATMTALKLDGVTGAMTFTLNSATAPTIIHRTG